MIFYKIYQKNWLGWVLYWYYYNWKRSVFDFIVADTNSSEEVVQKMLDLNEDFRKLAKGDLEKEMNVVRWVYSDIHWCGWDSSEKYMYFGITA